MAEEVKAVKAGIELVDGVAKVGIEVDVIDLVYEGAKGINEDAAKLVKGILEAARAGMDWKGVAKEYL